jgi:ABC-type bacteriocin/lantibiotic exporter with double-glycine peptidase domain
MALRCLGANYHLNEIREAIGIGRDGVNAADIQSAATQLGFKARALRIELEALKFLPSGTILHWDFEHFVVFERPLKDGGAIVVDPSLGPRRVGARELDKCVTGVAVIVERGVDPKVAQTFERPTFRLFADVLRGAPETAKVLVSSVAIQILAGLLPALSASVVDRVVPRHEVEMIPVLGLSLVVMACFLALFTGLRGLLLSHLRVRMGLEVGSRLIDHIVRLPLGYFQRRTPGDLLVRIRSSEALRETVSSTMLAGVLDGLLVLIYMGVLAWVLPTIALTVLLLSLLKLALFYAFRRRARELVSETQYRQGMADNRLIDLISGMETLKVNGAESNALARWTSLYVDVLNAALKRGVLSSITEAASATVRGAGPFVVLLVGARSVMVGQITMGTLLSALALAQGVIVAVSGLLDNVGQLDSMAAIVGRLDDVFLEEPEQPEPRPPAPTISGQVTLRDVGYRPTHRSPYLVRAVDLVVPAGAFVAIVGESGSGKSTIAALMAGLIPPTDGDVLYDGVPLRSMDLASLRRQIGVVVQRPQVFGDSVLDNITMLADFRLDDVEAAAKEACIHDDIMGMGMRYQTPLIAGGAISGGQRQRISLARALLRRPKILLLDEATSALDARTEVRIFQNILKLGCTRIVIAHRLSTVRHADFIVVTQAGRIVEVGTHEALLERGGVYASLVAAQTRAGDANEAAEEHARDEHPREGAES